MPACCCSLAGTTACLRCANNTEQYLAVLPISPTPGYAPSVPQRMAPADIEEIARRVAELLKEKKD